MFIFKTDHFAFHSAFFSLVSQSELFDSIYIFVTRVNKAQGIF